MCGRILQHHDALHCHSGLVHLPSWILVWFLNTAASDSTLNLVYNLADFVHKIAFFLLIWAAAKKETLAQREETGALLA